jgi:hypothetical protein
VGKGAYEVRDVLEDCYSGQYVLAAISAGMGAKGYRLYSNGYQFQSGLSMVFANDTPEPKEEHPEEAQEAPGSKQAQILPGTGQGPWVPIDEEELEREAAALKAAVGVPSVTETEKRTCGGIHKPGDDMECLVSFSGEPKFYSVLLNFGLRTQMRGDQGGMCNGVLLQKSGRVDAKRFRVSGQVPWCASGKYQVNEVVASEMRWSTFNGERVDGNVVMYLRNEDRSTFPDVKAVDEQAKSGSKNKQKDDGTLLRSGSGRTKAKTSSLHFSGRTEGDRYKPRWPQPGRTYGRSGIKRSQRLP